jgi:predicted RNA-binding Zn-ribbon protein involved in translation (DUF1610 family)
MTPPTTILFSRAELLRRRAALFGLGKGRIALLALGAGAGLAVALWFKNYLEHTENATQVLTITATGLPLVPVVLVVLGILAARDLRRKRVLCPCCGKEVLFDVTLATHRCGWCGEPIVSEPPPLAIAAGDPSLLPTRAEFAQNFRLAVGEGNRLGVALVLFLFGGLAGFIPVVDWADKRELPAWGHASLGGLLLLSFGLPIAGLFWHLKQASGRHHLRCPACERSLLLERRANLAVATGRCPVCGAAVLRDEPTLCMAFHSQATG